MNVCCVSCLYEITDVTALEKVKTELIHLRNKCKDDKTKAKRYKDCSSYVNKYMLFIENCDFHQSIIIDKDGIKLMSDTIFIPMKGKE